MMTTATSVRLRGICTSPAKGNWPTVAFSAKQPSTSTPPGSRCIVATRMQHASSEQRPQTRTIVRSALSVSTTLEAPSQDIEPQQLSQHRMNTSLSHRLRKAKAPPIRTCRWPFACVYLAIDPLFLTKCATLKLAYLYLFLCVFTLIPSTSHAQEDVLLFSGSVTQVVENLKNTIHSTISALDAAYSNNTFRTRQHLQILLNQLEAILENVTESTFSNLSDVEQKFFTDLAAQIDSLRTLEKVTANDAEKITRSMSSAIRNLPFADAVPIVFHYDPLYVVGGDENSKSKITIVVAGALLSDGEPTLTLDGKTCRRDGKIHTSLTFVCWNRTVVIDNSTAALKGTLRLYQAKSIWDHIFFRDEKQYTYDVVVSVLPRRLGTVVTKITYENEKWRREMRSQKFSEWNNHCAGARDFLFEFNARNDWAIDVNSINVKKCKGGKKSRCDGLRHVSENSFAYSCHLENHGKCIDLFVGKAKDARGHCGGRVEWYEVTTETVEQHEVLAEVEIVWGEDQAISLREGTRSVQILLKRADGERRIFTKSDRTDSWVDVMIDLAGKSAVISPKDLDIAMK